MAEGLQRRIEYSDLKFISSFAMEKILDFQTWEEPGEHARGNFRLLLSENETGEVLRESQWIETDAGYKLLYSEAYEKAVNQLYFNEDVSDGKMLEEQAARALFYYMYSDEGDYDSIVVRTYKQEQSVYVYQFPEDQEFPCVRNFSCRGMTEDQEYYIFADYTDYYTHGYEPVFTHYHYLTSYAVNRETGEVFREREWSDIECEWLYNEEYRKAVK